MVGNSKMKTDNRLPYAKVIINPTAGAGGTGKKWPSIMRLLQKLGLRFEHDVTEAPGHAIELAKAAARDGYELVVSVGGDGTINEIVNGLYHAESIRDVSLGIISTGTGSDCIRTIGVPRPYQAACECLLRPKKLVVDLGAVEYMDSGEKVKRLFVNFAGLGLDAEIVKATTQKFKALGSLAAYLMGLLNTVLFYRNREATLVLDGKSEERKICVVPVSNGKYGAGGMLATPDADPGDGLFDVLIVDDLSKPDLLWSLPRIYRGTHLTHPKVSVRRARQVEIKPSRDTFLQADGELLGKAPAHFQILPAMLTVLI